MTHETGTSRRLSRVMVCAIAAFSMLISAPTGCSSAGTRSGDPIARLDAMIAAGRIDERAQRAPAAPGLPDELISPPLVNYAGVPTVENTLARLVAEAPEPIETGGVATAESIGLFITGRAKLLAGDLAGAIEDLRAAATIDPSAAEPWRAMGDAHRRLGDGLSAVAAYRRALELDPFDAESLLRVGLWSMDRGDHEAAVDALGRARRLIAEAGPRDPGLAIVLDYHLGRALIAMNERHAGAALLAGALDLPDQFDSPTAYAGELEFVYRTRYEAWVEAGDSLLYIHNMSGALDAYKRAAELPSLDPAGVLPRLIHAAMRIGDAAGAARIAVDALRAGADVSGERLLPLVRHITKHSGIGATLAAAIEAERASLGAAEIRRLGSLYARAAANAADSDSAAARILRGWLAEHPSDTGAVADLFALAGSDDAAIAEETIRLIESAPANEARYAQTMLERFPSVAAALDATAQSPASAASTLLRARVLQRLGRLNDAITALASAQVSQGPIRAVIATVRIEVLASAGRLAEAERLLPEVGSASEPMRSLLLARALTPLGRMEEALDTLRAALAKDTAMSLAGDPRELDAAMFASNLAWGLGDAEGAETFARRALANDPAYEPAHARLIDLFAPGGPSEDPRLLAESVRALREADPSSRTLRWLRARELAGAGQLDRAARELRGLADEDPDAPVVDLLTAIWMRLGQTVEAETWLRARIAERPNAAGPVRGLARLLANDDRAEQAVALLDDWITRYPADDDAARQAESILRDNLARTEEADRRTLARLEDRPRTLSRAVERAPALVRLGDAAAAADDLLESLPGARISAPALDLVRALFLINQSAREGLGPTLDVALRLTAHVFERVDPMPVELYDQRLDLMARVKAPAEESGDILVSGINLHRERASELAAVAVARLATLDQPEAATRVAERAYTRLLDPDARFFATWVQATWLGADHIAATRAIRAIAGADLAFETLRTLQAVNPARGDRGNAELAMFTGDTYAGRDAPFEAVVAMYELALEFDPNHAVAHNNFGYYLAEEGVRLAEAERLIRRSLELNPNDPFATDSLGWVLYKQGILTDERDETGRLIREGAVSVLLRASAMPINQASPEVIDHLGDALWAAGDRDRAQNRWRAAVALLEESIAAAGVRRQPTETFVSDLQRVRAKLDDAAAGREPKIAEIIGPGGDDPPRPSQ